MVLITYWQSMVADVDPIDERSKRPLCKNLVLTRMSVARVSVMMEIRKSVKERGHKNVVLEFSRLRD